MIFCVFEICILRRFKELVAIELILAQSATIPSRRHYWLEPRDVIYDQ